MVLSIQTPNNVSSGGGGGGISEAVQVENTVYAPTLAANQALDGTHILPTESHVGTDINISSAGSITLGIGTYLINVNTHQHSTSQRHAPQIRLRVDGTNEGPIGSSGYIRSANSQNESSCHISGYILVVSSGTKVVQVTMGNESTLSGTCTWAAGKSSISVVKIIQRLD